MTDLESSYTYGVLKRAIAEIDRSGGQITLSDLAASVGMSAPHFQRLFSKWVGVSPKKYQQYLTLEHSKQLLSEHHSLLDAALESGLSGTGRLHDLFITWEAMTPGEFAKKANGLTISYGWVESPFGEALIMTTHRGICGISFSEEMGRDTAIADMMKRWPNAGFQEETKLSAWNGMSVFDHKNPPRLHVIGAPFQIKVWEALMRIPSGHVSTYRDVASAIGSPKATRAVGTAIGRNPISWLIPCHRALRKSGELGGYHWGLPIKRTMLAYESARRDATSKLQKTA